MSLRSLPRTATRVAVPLALTLAVLTGACAGDGPPSAAPSTTTTAPPATTSAGAAGPTPKASSREAVEALLAAEQAGDHDASYRLLTGAGRTALSAAAWARRRSEVAAVTGFTIERADARRVVVVVEHEPGLDPFVGLSPARERQTWRARKEGSGWLLEPEPDVVALHPADAGAPPATLAWARAVQACDTAAARSHQAVDVLYGTTDVAAKLCGTTTSLTVGRPGAVTAGPSSQELIAQYGVEVLEWARSVGVTGGERPFHVVLAPIGSVWRVVGVSEP